MARENNRITRSERSNEKQSQYDAASFPGRTARRSKANLNHTWSRDNVGYLRHMNTSRLNDLYERGSL